MSGPVSPGGNAPLNRDAATALVFEASGIEFEPESFDKYLKIYEFAATRSFF